MNKIFICSFIIIIILFYIRLISEFKICLYNNKSKFTFSLFAIIILGELLIVKDWTG